jgi:hypothetical protein
MDFWTTGERLLLVAGLISFVFSVMGGIGYVVKKVAYLVRRIDKIDMAIEESTKERKNRKKETAIIFRFLLTMHSGMKKRGDVNGELDCVRKKVERYVWEQLGDIEEDSHEESVV